MADARERPRRRGVTAAIARAAAAAGAGVALVPDVSHAQQHTYTPTTATTNWSAGTGWSPAPTAGGATTAQLTFVGTNTTVLPNSLANTNVNDLPGAYQLNILDLQGTGPATGAGTINLNSTSPSTGLNFVANGGTNPVVNLNAINGAAGLTYTVNQPTLLSNNLTFQGNGSATFVYAGLISGSASVGKAGSSVIAFTGANTYNGGTTISLGNVRLGSNSAGGVGSVSAGPLGTGPVSLAGGAIVARDGTNRVLDNAVTIDGNVTISSSTNPTTGSVTLGAPVTLSASRTVSANGTAVFNGGITETTGANATFTKGGPGTLTVSGTSGYTGGTTVNAGVLRFTAASAVGGGTTGAITIATDATLSLGFTATQALLDRVQSTSTGAIGFNNEPSLFSFTNLPSIYIGAATGTTLNFNGAVPVGTGNTYRLGGGGGGTLTVTGTNALTGGNALDLAHPVANTIVLSAANDFAGATSVGAATVLRLTNGGAIANTSGVTVANGGTVQLTNGVTVTGRTINISGNGSGNFGPLQTNGAGAVATWDGPVVLGADQARMGVGATTGTLNVTGPIDDGTATRGPAFRSADGSTDTAAVVLSGASTYGGATGVVTGTVKLDGGDNRLPVGTTLNIGLNGNTVAQFDLNGQDQTVAGLARLGAAASNFISNSRPNDPSVLTVNNAATNTFNGVIRDNGGVLGLVKSNTGSLTISGTSNTYSGGTSITAGTLIVGADAAAGTGDVTVASGATLTLTGGSTNNYINNAASLILASGTPTVNLTYTGTDQIFSLSLDGGATFLPNGVYGSSSSPAPVENQLSVFTGSGTLTVVPEPASAGLAAAAITAVGLLARRRRSRQHG